MWFTCLCSCPFKWCFNLQTVFPSSPSECVWRQALVPKAPRTLLCARRTWLMCTALSSAAWTITQPTAEGTSGPGEWTCSWEGTYALFKMPRGRRNSPRLRCFSVLPHRDVLVSQVAPGHAYRLAWNVTRLVICPQHGMGCFFNAV